MKETCLLLSSAKLSDTFMTNELERLIRESIYQHLFLFATDCTELLNPHRYRFIDINRCHIRISSQLCMDELNSYI